MIIPCSNTFNKTTDRHKWANDNQHICLLPYTSLQYFHSSKTVSPCCNLEKPKSGDFLTPIHELKQAIESGQTYENCKTCYQCESEGKISERTRYLIGLDDQQLDNLIHKQKIDREFYIHCTLSNLCNMACRSCNSTTSSLFSKIDLGYEILVDTMSEDLGYWQSLLDSISRETQIHDSVNLVISGGEGMVQSDFHKIVSWLIETGISKKITLTINTNGSIDDDRLFTDLCSNFKRVSLAVSVDSIYENYHYVRWPANWNKIHKNLNSFVGYQKTFENFNFFLTPVWSINNIFYLPAWIEFFESFAAEHKIDITAYDTPLWQPDWLDVQNLPTYIKNILLEKISLILSNQWLIQNKTFHANITNLVDLCMQPTTNQSLVHWKKYLTYSAKWDVRTNTNLAEHNVLLYNIMNQQDKDLFLALKNQANSNYAFVS